MTEKDFSNKVREAGGAAYIVGGWVRDKLMGKDPHDKDYVVVGLSQAAFQAAFPESKLIGNAFPVFLLEIDGVKCEVAFARKERKIGTGYRGFEIAADNVSIQEDLFRRDTTVNSIALDISTGEILDPYQGKRDIEAGLLRPVSEHFCEDPVRALRAARQAAQLEFDLTEDLLVAMKKCQEELQAEPAERLFGELKKALESQHPAIFFRTLQRADLLESLFPELHALIGKIQPVEFHPEGDAFEHTMNLIDNVAAQTDNPVVVFCGLVHDLGKGETPADILPHHYGHEERGLQVLEKWNSRAKFPNLWTRSGALVIQEHMRAPILKKPGKIVELVLLLDKNQKYISPADFNLIIAADHGSLPVYLEFFPQLRDRLLKVTGNQAPASVRGAEIGKWLLRTRTEVCSKWLAEMGW